MGASLGLVETRGLLAAVTGADAALKAAQVTLKGLEKVGGGLVTVVLTGEVAALGAALAAAQATASGLTTFCQTRLIARLAEEVRPVLKLDDPPRGPKEAPKDGPLPENSSAGFGPEIVVTETPKPVKKAVAPRATAKNAEDIKTAGPGEELKTQASKPTKPAKKTKRR